MKEENLIEESEQEELSIADAMDDDSDDRPVEFIKEE